MSSNLPPLGTYFEFSFDNIPDVLTYQGCEVGVDMEETELRLDRLELTLPLWLCVV